MNGRLVQLTTPDGEEVDVIELPWWLTPEDDD